MNVLIVDTSSWISYFAGKGNPEIDIALSEGRVYQPPLVIAELLSARLSEKERSALIDFVKELPLCNSNYDHWISVGDLRSRLLKKGFQISTPDAHIARCALDLNCYLLSEDRIFERIAKDAGLRLLTPSST